MSLISLRDEKSGQLKSKKGTAFSVSPIQIGPKHLLFEVVPESYTYLNPKHTGWEYLVDKLEEDKWVPVIKFPLSKRFEPGLYRLHKDWI